MVGSLIFLMYKADRLTRLRSIGPYSLPTADPVFEAVSLCSLCGTLHIFLTSVLGFGVREYRITKFNLV